MKSSLLIDESPLVILPTLATAIGLNQAIVLQQLNYLLRKGHGKVLEDSHRYIFNTYEAWRRDYFPFWSEDTIQRIFTELEKRSIVVSVQPEGNLSRRKYYRIGEGARQHLTIEIVEQQEILQPPASCGDDDRKLRSSRTPQNAMIDTASCGLPLTETTTKTTTETTGARVDPSPDVLRETETAEQFQERVVKPRDAIFAKWNRSTRLPRARTLSPARLKLIAARLKDPFFADNWAAAIERLDKSDFATGNAGGRGWVATFEWFLHPESVLKIMEGKYDNRESHQNGANTDKRPNPRAYEQTSDYSKFGA